MQVQLVRNRVPFETQRTLLHEEQIASDRCWFVRYAHCNTSLI